MIKKVKTYLGRLENLTTEELDHYTERLVRVEKRNVALVIAHIAEMSRRKGHLERGYKNLFDYCTRRLKLSEGSVARRIQVANVAVRFPQILVALAENRMSLTVAGQLAPVLTESNVATLLADCAGMTKREAEERLVALRPKPVFTASIRRKPTPPNGQTTTPITTTSVQEPRPTPRVSPSILEPARPELFNFRFAADQEFKTKFERLAEVLGVENPLQHMAEIMEQALDVALDKKDLQRKRARRLERQKNSSDKPQEESGPGKICAKEQKADSRYIPSEVRERVHARGNHQCEYKSADGRRCRSRTGLQVDHERPYAIFRSHEERFLRLLCPAHNRLAAEHVYGAEFIQRKINASRRGPSPSSGADSS